MFPEWHVRKQRCWAVSKIMKFTYILMTKGALNKKKTLFTSTLNLNVRKILVKCYIWSIALYGAETRTLQIVGWKSLKVLVCCAGEGWRKSVGPIM
jgi:hypothetical protein